MAMGGWETLQIHKLTLNESPQSSAPTQISGGTPAATESIGIPHVESTYLVCIGSVYLEAASSSLKNGKVSKRIAIQPNGSSLHLYSSTKTSTYAGNLKQPEAGCLQSLIRKYKLEIDAFVPELTAIPEDRRKPGLQTLHIVLDIFCPLDDRKDVGRALGTRAIFLQDPFKNARKLDYMNPHLFELSEAARELLAKEGTEIAHKEQNSQKLNSKLGVEELTNRNNEISDIFTQSSYLREEGLLGSNLSISSKILTQLKPHQMSGVRWMFQKENAATTSRTKRLLRGGILADDMGMGKTLTTLALIATSNERNKFNASGGTLLICPKSVIASWTEQIERHTQLLAVVIDSTNRKTILTNTRKYDILITTYGVVTNKVSDTAAAIKNHHWKRIVLDEAHVIRERKNIQVKRIFALDADYRWCITGTPVQNKLDDYGSLLEFLKHPYYGTREKFNNTIIKPLRSRGPHALQMLKHLISETTIRRLKSGTSLDLPEPQNVDQRLAFQPDEKQLYELLQEFTANQIERAHCNGLDETGIYLAQLRLRLRQVCNHGIDLLPLQLQNDLRSLKIEGDSRSVISVALSHVICELCKESKSENATDLTTFTDCQHVVCATCKVEDGDCPICIQANQEEVSTSIQPSTKVLALLQNLRSERHLKSIIFSCWTKMLDLVEIALRRENIEFMRIDGTLSSSDRKTRINEFRSSSSGMTLLLTLGTGSVGLDLTVASRIHLLEPQFNPMLEEQALARVHRIGQTQPVKTIRYIIDNSYEEEILKRQFQKLQLAEICVGGSIGNKKITAEDLENLNLVIK
ncbi:hypothetical protein TWF694_005793 [Orbilia ellipsospora]|uniref:Uncharacterized protein n=1 Tax=Orbilia ellipsospora TaxID=2528407 RepID=A0AAV9WRX9_9PEZI